MVAENTAITFANTVAQMAQIGFVSELQKCYTLLDIVGIRLAIVRPLTHN